MRANRYIFLFLAGILTIGLNSCSDYLDTQPYSFNTVDKLYTSAEGAELGLTGCYNTLNASIVQGTAWGGSFIVAIPLMFNGGTDEVVKRDGFSNPNWAPFGDHSYSSQNEKITANWITLFAGINRANYLLENIDGINMDENRKVEIKGEAHFLRGVFYQYLSFAYGSLPIYTTANHDPDAQREPIEEVYKLIIADFTFAYKNLGDRARQAGRADKWSAAGYLAKAYTYLASCKKNNVGAGLNFDLNSFDWVNADEMYKEAKTVTDDIIKNSGFKLTQNYDYLFRETTGSWQKEESLFSLLGSKNSSNGNYNLLLYWQIPTGANSAGGGYGWMRPTGEHFYKYESSDIRRTHNLVGTLRTSNPLENIEGVNYYIPKPVTTPSSSDSCVGKYRYRDPRDKDISAAWSDGDIILLRYADILLLNAEALYFLGDEPGARSRLKEVRERVAENTTQLDILTSYYHNDDFITELLASRSRELCFEGWRRIDLIRFGKMGETINGLSDNLGFWNTIVPILKENWQEYKIWFPIPRTEIDLSPIEQNPGYN